ncbi:hypothetical protein PF010_g1680 [Phytophthora fragariae]|uniref:SET domain-containing protein n=1 Tax=Phytophthora fragariae TaxID=53985 RepID=A0A6G0LZB2_9STRA|nr:hypothetical protein PF010_g1680 [Phytophthora fragariae]
MEVALKRVADAVRRTRGGVVSIAIEARLIPGMGVGIVAREHIPKDTLVFQAGQDVWYPFSAEHALETAQQKAPGFLNQLNQLLASSRALREGSAFVPSALVLGVHMLVNFPHAEDPETTLMAMASMDTPPLDELYVNALPRYVDLPLYWNDKQFEELQGCEEARRAMQHGARFYSQVYKHLFGTNNQFVNQEAFFWAISTLMSRATSGQNQPFALIPFFVTGSTMLTTVMNAFRTSMRRRASQFTHGQRGGISTEATHFNIREDDVFLRANNQQMAPWLRSCLHIRMGEKQTLLRAASKYA